MIEEIVFVGLEIKIPCTSCEEFFVFPVWLDTSCANHSYILLYFFYLLRKQRNAPIFLNEIQFHGEYQYPQRNYSNDAKY